MTKREVDMMLDEAIDILLEAPDETRERHPDCRWSDCDRLVRNDATTMLWDIKACLRGELVIPEYFEKYNAARLEKLNAAKR